MRRARRVLSFGLLCVLGFAIFVRISPSDDALWHLPAYPSGLGHKDASSGHTWHGVQDGDGVAQMIALDQIIAATPRTQAIAGSLDSGMITYITRSSLWRFPDYTTVERDVLLVEGGPATLAIQGRARFGYSDLGVNKRRILRWLGQLQAGG